MQVTQIKNLLDTVNQEVLGTDTTLVNEDLSNLVDVGTEIFSSDKVDNYVKKLVDQIGKMVFDSRVYEGTAPSVLMDSWEYGSVVEKVQTKLPNVEENDSWNLQNGKSYDQNVFYQPSVSVKFFNSKATFDIPMSFTTNQVKESFTNATQMNSFLSMLQTSVQNAMTLNLDNLITRTLNNAIATVYDQGQTLQKIDLLTSYNNLEGTTLTADKAITDKNFLRYANLVINTYRDRLTKYSTLFNVGKQEQFSPREEQHLVLLSDFASAGKVYLDSETYHQENTEIRDYETVPFWQTSGSDYGFNSISTIDATIKTSDGTKEVKAPGIIGFLFDSQAIGVSCANQRTTSVQNAKAEFYTNFTKFDAMYYNDFNSNMVVFYLGTVAG